MKSVADVNLFPHSSQTTLNATFLGEDGGFAIFFFLTYANIFLCSQLVFG